MRYFLLAATALTLGACSTYSKDDTNKYGEMNKKTYAACDMRTYSVFFDTGSSDFDTAASAELNNIADAYKGCDLFRLEIEGHADSVGSSPANLALSERRAESVFGALSARGVTADRISIIPLGEREAVFNETPNAWERKVDVRLIP